MFTESLEKDHVIVESIYFTHPSLAYLGLSWRQLGSEEGNVRAQRDYGEFESRVEKI